MVELFRASLLQRFQRHLLQLFIREDKGHPASLVLVRCVRFRFLFVELGFPSWSKCWDEFWISS